MKLLAALAVSLGLAVAPADAQTAGAGAPAGGTGRLYQTGVEKQAEAEAASDRDEARRLYREAVVAYEAVVAADPQHCEARLYDAVCRTQLALLTPAETERIQQLLEASRRFGRAAECPGAEPNVFEQWAILLRTHLYNLLPEPAQRLAVLQETVRVCERGLKIATAPTPRAQLQRHLGSALMWSTEFVGDPALQKTLLEQAVAHLRSANQVVAARQTLYQNNDLGTALLSLGRLAGDRTLLREAVTELETALKFYPNQYDTYYTLAAACSLLGDADQAARFLSVAIDHDTAGEYARMAATDPDLAAVRDTPAYTAALDRRRRRAAEDRAAELHAEAVRTHQTADRVRVTPTAVAMLQQAVAQYQQVIELVPDHAQAQALCATALGRLAQLNAADPEQRARLAAAASQRFAAAASCPQADPQVYDQWAAFLLQGQYPLLNQPADQEHVLREACTVLEQGISQARFSGLRGRLEAQLGTCLVLLAQNHSPSPTNSIALYADALKHFQAASRAEPINRSARYHELWGIALLRVGQAAKDSRLLRQATERLLTSLELTPDNPLLQYNLACAYAQLLQPEQALRYLERCLADDPRETLRAAALQDPDLVPLHERDEFRALFRPRRSPLADQQPGLSGK